MSFTNLNHKMWTALINDINLADRPRQNSNKFTSRQHAAPKKHWAEQGQTNDLRFMFFHIFYVFTGTKSMNAPTRIDAHQPEKLHQAICSLSLKNYWDTWNNFPSLRMLENLEIPQHCASFNIELRELLALIRCNYTQKNDAWSYT